MKHFFVILLFIFIPLKVLPAELLNEEDIKGLYLDFSLYGRYIPSDGIVKTSLFYRLPLFKIDNFAFRNARIDFGVENIFSLNANTVNAFIDFKPFSFFKLRASAGYINYYNIIKHFGFSTYDDKNPIRTYSEYSGRKGTKSDGYTIELNPSIKINVYKFTLLTDLRITYTEMNNGPYYYDNMSFLIRKQKDFSYIFNAYFLFNIYPINVGINYNLNNTQFAGNLGQMVGVVGVFEHNFTDKLKLYAIAHVGEYVAFDYLTYQLFISLEVGVRYRLF